MSLLNLFGGGWIRGGSPKKRKRKPSETPRGVGAQSLPSIGQGWKNYLNFMSSEQWKRGLGREYDKKLAPDQLLRSSNRRTRLERKLREDERLGS